MGRRPFWIELAEFSPRVWCDDCGGVIADTCPTMWWNPNKRARIRNLCDGCYWARQEDIIMAKLKAESEGLI